MRALVGTAKGLLIYSIGDKPRLEGKHFLGFNITMVYADEASGRWWVGISHKHWGQKLHYSDDRGRSWKSVAMPVLRGKTMPNGKPAKLRQLWCMAGTASKTLWLGTDPGALFRSDDGGASFSLVDSLWDHPSRQTEGQWFGAGSDFPFIHSIILNPLNSEHIYIGVSCAGVFESLDGGASWSARNQGLIAAYLPNPNVEVGHDPHILRINQNNPNVLWQQNHCGIYVTDNGGKEWEHVSKEGTIPYYGFGLVISEDPKEAWVIPVESDEQRIAPDLRLRVYHTRDRGKTWTDDSKGLPEEEVFDIVLRQSFVRIGETMLFGTTNGNLFYRSDDKAEWHEISHNLTKVNSAILSK
jgi:photosystem II stability/assembly factor-like uncharacterized protein